MQKDGILAIDDDPEIRTVVSQALEIEGYEVFEASDGDEGWNAIQGERPDLVITDIMMPNLSGLELVQRLRTDPLVCNTPIVILSGKDSEEDQVRGLDLGADDYITKPVSMATLTARIRAVLRRRDGVFEQIVPQETGPFSLEGLERLSDLTFDTFVIGGVNSEAAVAAKAVAERPGIRHNPLFIYGGPGRGKTHLMCALANEAFARNPKLRILYISSEVFSQQLLDAYEHRSVQQLRAGYLRSDILLIDDIQFLAISPSLQSVAAEIMSEMYHQGKQIVITSDRRPDELKTIVSDIKSKFSVGYVVGMGLPDMKLRSDILQFKTRRNKWPLKPGHVDHLAANLDSDVRTLEGIAKKLVAMHVLLGEEIHESDIDELISTVTTDEDLLDLTDSSESEILESIRSETPEVEPEEEQLPTSLYGTIIEEILKKEPVERVWGLLDEVSEALPDSADHVIVVLGTSGPLVMDTVEALAGRDELSPVIPEGPNWAYMVSPAVEKPSWLIIGTNTKPYDNGLWHSILKGRNAVFIVAVNAMAPRVIEERSLISSVAMEKNRIVVGLVSTMVQSGNPLTMKLLRKSMRRLYRVPDAIPVQLDNTVSKDLSHRWLWTALNS